MFIKVWLCSNSVRKSCSTGSATFVCKAARQVWCKMATLSTAWPSTYWVTLILQQRPQKKMTQMGNQSLRLVFKSWLDSTACRLPCGFFHPVCSSSTSCLSAGWRHFLWMTVSLWWCSSRWWEWVCVTRTATAPLSHVLSMCLREACEACKECCEVDRLFQGQDGSHCCF